MNRTRRTSCWLVLVVGLASCSSQADKSQKASKPADPKSKEAAVQVLKDFLAAAEGKDYDKAATIHIALSKEGPGTPAETCQRILERKDITAKGIEILAAKGNWTKVADTEPDLAERIAEGVKLSAADIYELSIKDREGATHFGWDGKQLRIIRVDDIGELEFPVPAKGAPIEKGLPKKALPPKKAPEPLLPPKVENE